MHNKSLMYRVGSAHTKTAARVLYELSTVQPANIMLDSLLTDLTFGCGVVKHLRLVKLNEFVIYVVIQWRIHNDQCLRLLKKRRTTFPLPYNVSITTRARRETSNHNRISISIGVSSQLIGLTKV